MAPTVTTTSVILSSNIIQNEDILIPANTGTPGNMVIKMKSSRWDDWLPCVLDPAVVEQSPETKAYKNCRHLCASEKLCYFYCNDDFCKSRPIVKILSLLKSQINCRDLEFNLLPPFKSVATLPGKNGHNFPLIFARMISLLFNCYLFSLCIIFFSMLLMSLWRLGDIFHYLCLSVKCLAVWNSSEHNWWLYWPVAYWTQTVCLFVCLVFNGTFSTNRLYHAIGVWSRAGGQDKHIM